MLDSFRRTVRLYKTTGSFVVKRQLAPHVKLLIAAIAGAALLGAVFLIYRYGLSMAGFERAVAVRTLEQLEQENRRLREENQQLHESLARAERSNQMAQVIYEDLDKALKEQTQDNVKLREEVAFYRNIITPADKKAGLRVQSLDVHQAGAPNDYRFKLVLIQALKHDRAILGTAALEIIGTQGGQEIILRVPGPGEKPIQVNLKYFQDIEGKFLIPRGFQPTSIRVRVTPNAGGTPVDALYRWPAS